MGAVLDLLFPLRCASCGRGSWPICESCAAAVGVITPPWCARCGRPAEEPLGSCVDCPPRVLDAARAPFLYEGPIARALRGMKFSGWRALAHALAPSMAEVFDLDADVLTWVPLASARRARRGFDQAEAIATAAGPVLALPVSRLLDRVRDTSPQAKRRALERRRALAGAFVAVAPPPRRVVLVDDVLTTGATTAACAEVLKRAGAERVFALTLARSLGGSVPARCWGDARGLAGDTRTAARAGI